MVFMPNLFKSCHCSIYAILVSAMLSIIIFLCSCHKDYLEVAPLSTISINLHKFHEQSMDKSEVIEFDAVVSIEYEKDTIKYHGLFVLADSLHDIYAIDYSRSDIIYAIIEKPFKVYVETSIMGNLYRGESDIILLADSPVSVDIDLHTTIEIHTTGQLNGHEWVDLGLPSGTLWATTNIGATKPEDYGDYFAWGETEPKENYDWVTYRYCNGDMITLTKYCSDSRYGNNSFTDYIAILEASDDAATAKWGEGWRMPTQAEMQELVDNCTVTGSTMNGINGLLFSSSNGNSIFLPVAGIVHYTNVSSAGSYGDYWTSTLYADEPAYSNDFYLNLNGTANNNGNARCYGASVRPVCGTTTSYGQSYTINFNENGGSGYMQPQTFSYGIAQLLSQNSYTRNGYYFYGWNTSPDGTGTSYYDRQTVSIFSNITLYAQWIDNNSSQPSGSLDGYDYVDLGLPSGLKWATCNVGATSPENYGNYYAWGETTTKTTYSESNYTYSDNPETLPSSADVATNDWGSSWRMPTETEIQELINNCDKVWTTLNGVNGYLFVGTNGNSIFLPAAGYHYENSPYDAGSGGYYWSSSLYTSYTSNAQELDFYFKNCSVAGNVRYCGRSVRPVCAQ